MGHKTRVKLLFVLLIVCMVFSPLSVLANVTMNGLNGTLDDLPPRDWHYSPGSGPAGARQNGTENNPEETIPEEFIPDELVPEENFYEDHLTRGAAPVQIAISTENWFTVGELPVRQMGLNVLGTTPLLNPVFDEAHLSINERIEDIINDLIGEARRARARSIDFSYEIHHTPSISSILIHATIASAISRSLVRSVNFCPRTGRFLTIREAMEYDIVPLVNHMLAERMRRLPENYYAAQSISIDNQAFYMTESRLAILFDEFQLSSMVSGIYTLELRVANIRVAHLPREQLLSNDHTYNLIMVPLGFVLRQLNYVPIWTGYNRRAEIWDFTQNLPHLVAWMHAGVNYYHTNEMTRSLEAPPYLNSNNLIYVPITFFEQILPLTVYSIDAFGNITFLAYRS